MKQTSLWQGQEVRKTLEEALEETIKSFYAIEAWKYPHWQIGYSGGKDSTAVVTLLAYLFLFDIFPRPKRVVVQYADTGMEIPPLQQAALTILRQLEMFGIETQVVLPELDQKWFVYMFGRGIPLLSTQFRYCTRILKADPMAKAMEKARNREKVLLITGVREGESTARTERIVAACNKDGGECGQGYMHVKYEKSTLADPHAPLREWGLPMAGTARPLTRQGVTLEEPCLSSDMRGKRPA